MDRYSVDDFVRYSPFGITSTTTKMIFAIMVSPCVWDEFAVHRFLQHQGANLAFVCTAEGQYHCLVLVIPPIKRTPTMFLPICRRNLPAPVTSPRWRGLFCLMVCAGDAVKIWQAAPIYLASRAELGGAIRSSVNSFPDPARDTLSVCDLKEREDAQGNGQPKDDGCADHHLLLVLFFGEALLLLGFLLFS